MSQSNGDNPLVGSSTPAPVDVSTTNQEPCFSASDSVTDAILIATKSIGGQRGYVTKLLQHLGAVIESGDHSLASKVLELQQQIKSAQEKYSRSVKVFCQTLDEKGDRGEEYMEQLQARDEEVKEADDQVNAFLLEGLAVGTW